MDARHEHRDLVSVYGAVALSWGKGRRCTESTFRTYVSRGDAPEPVTRVRRQPFWSRAQLGAWLAADVDQRRSAPVDPPALELADPGLLDVEEDSGDAVFAAQALERLPGVIAELEQIVGANRRRQEAVVERHQDAVLTSLSPGAIVEWAMASRRARADQQEIERLAGRVDRALPHLQAARGDLERTKQWIEQVRAWSTAVATDLAAERESRTADAWLRGLDEHLPLDGALPTVEYALADPSRVSYLINSGQGPWGAFAPEQKPLWGDLSPEERRAVDPGAIVLDGADFGYRWSIPIRAGEWRLSWHRSEMYFEFRSPHEDPIVLPLASIEPPATLLRDEIEWLAPFERIQSTPGAAGLLLREIELEDSVGWPGLRSEDDW